MTGTSHTSNNLEVFFIFLILNKGLRKRISQPLHENKPLNHFQSFLFIYLFIQTLLSSLVMDKSEGILKNVVYIICIIIFNDIIINHYCYNSHYSLYNYNSREFSLQTFEPH